MQIQTQKENDLKALESNRKGIRIRQKDTSTLHSVLMRTTCFTLYGKPYQLLWNNNRDILFLQASSFLFMNSCCLLLSYFK